MTKQSKEQEAIMIKCITLTALMLGSMATAPSAMAQTACGPREQLIAKLEGTFGESRLGVGIRDNVSLFEIWASLDSGSWTILVTNTEGISCIMATGENWHDTPAITADHDLPA